MLPHRLTVLARPSARASRTLVLLPQATSQGPSRLLGRAHRGYHMGKARIALRHHVGSLIRVCYSSAQGLHTQLQRPSETLVICCGFFHML